MTLQKHKQLDLTIIGAGMIVNDLLLPSALHLQRLGYVGELTVCDMRTSSLRALSENKEIRDAFPGQGFSTLPGLSEPDSTDKALYKKVLEKRKPYQAVIIALPDQLHYPVLKDVLDYNQHILCVKPLTLKYSQGVEIEKKAYERGCFVGVEYHKRFDRRALVARKHYRNGDFGEFILGDAKLIEPYYYRHSNFQNWFTCENTDPFVYVGCHYVDLTCFITGLRPAEVSVAGVKGKFPNGKEGFLWSSGRVRFENGALLSVSNGLGYPDEAGGSNDQGLNMYFEGKNKGGVLGHNDQFRGVQYGFVENQSKLFQYINPDFFRLAPWEGEGLKPVGYGYDSVAATITTACAVEAEAEGASESKALEIRRKKIEAENDRGLIATPSNSAFNELVQEAARLSILSGGDTALIENGPAPSVRLKK
jgi:predicted dehydrogenase